MRFIYDSNMFQRFNFPLLKINENFININWINAMNIFLNNLYKYFINNLNIQVIIGDLVDIELLNLNKEFFNLLGIEIFLESNINYFNNDMVNDFLVLPLDLESIKYLLLISLNLRLELPILNSKFFRLKEKIKMFSIGISGYFYSNNIQYLGNNVVSIIDFIKGKTNLNMELFNNCFNMNSFNFFLKPVGLQILIGQSFFSLNNSYFLFKILQKYVDRYYKYSWCNILFMNVGYLNYFCYLNIKKRINFLHPTFLFLNNVDNVSFLNKFFDSYIVYRGSFFDVGAKKSDLIFPSLTFFEDNLKYKNYTGKTEYTRKVISNPVLNNKDFFNLLNILKFNYFKKNLFKIVNFKILLKYFPNFFKKFGVISFSNNNNIHIFIKTNNFIIETKLFNSLIINYYKNDVYCRNSRHVSLASLEYIKTIMTYSK